MFPLREFLIKKFRLLILDSYLYLSKHAEAICLNEQREELYLTKENEEKIRGLKSGFRTIKISKTGHEYPYGMGAIAFPDSLEKPARTMVTSEHTISRMSHVIRDPGNGRLRMISPEEAEMINTFPVGWTSGEDIALSNRYFTMGNALVVDLIKTIGIEIYTIIQNENFEI